MAGIKIEGDIIWNVPYHPQEHDYTCIPACMRMMLEFFGHKFTEEELCKMLKTKKDEGTIVNDLAMMSFSYRLHDKGISLNCLSQRVSLEKGWVRFLENTITITLSL